MQTVIQDPGETEKTLLDAGFEVALSGDAFLVSLGTRRVTRGEVADVPHCETEDLLLHSSGVLVR